jgi:hypothetical protein
MLQQNNEIECYQVEQYPNVHDRAWRNTNRTALSSSSSSPSRGTSSFVKFLKMISIRLERLLATIATVVLAVFVTELSIMISVYDHQKQRQIRVLHDDNTVHLHECNTHYGVRRKSMMINGTNHRIVSDYDNDNIAIDDGLLVSSGDYIYTIGDWDSAPIVMEEYKLIFFSSAKVGCTVWKQLFRRMMKIHNWTAENTPNMIPWNPETNGLRYLYHYDRINASRMMTDPTWTRAIFIRDPKERLLSAYLDKVVNHASFIKQKCCPFLGDCATKAAESLSSFFVLMQTCSNAHWTPQSRRMEAKYWPYINYIGRMENIEHDAQQLLQNIGAWDQFGATGWGINGTQSVFGLAAGDVGRTHATNASERRRLYFTAELEDQVEYYYRDDYVNPRFNFSRNRIFTSTTTSIQLR